MLGDAGFGEVVIPGSSHSGVRFSGEQFSSPENRCAVPPR
jgi:hypothetical protein